MEVTYFFSWSHLDLEDQETSLDDRITRLTDIIKQFSTIGIHLVSKYTNNNETETVLDLWRCFKVTFCFL